jgi:hypothetical protein
LFAWWKTRVASGIRKPPALFDRLVNRDRVHSEATVQVDIRTLLLSGDLGLSEHNLDRVRAREMSLR